LKTEARVTFVEKEGLRFLQISEKRLERFERLERLERAIGMGDPFGATLVQPLPPAEFVSQEMFLGFD
jgi:hypothetical protein